MKEERLVWEGEAVRIQLKVGVVFGTMMGEDR